jgi:hypothetical protein
MSQMEMTFSADEPARYLPADLRDRMVRARSRPLAEELVPLLAIRDAAEVVANGARKSRRA